MSSTASTPEPVRVLAADDDAAMRGLIRHSLEKAGMEVVLAVDGDEALQRFDESFRVVLLDLHMPGRDGLACLAAIKQRRPATPCVMISAESETKFAVAAMRAGAFDYVTKPLNAEELVLLVRQAARTDELGRENTALREALGGARTNCRWIGRSAASKDILKKVVQIARTDSTVLITGETGTGKSLLARVLRDVSPRAAAPFVTVSCAALPRDLIESELFGHEKGAFTGAVRERPGRMELAGAGILFLDEVGDLPLATQPKVLRALQEREFERLGGNTTYRLEARVVTATNRDLEQMCAARTFRRDLYYRLDVLRIHLPPLRERREDIPAIATDFLETLAGPDHPALQLSGNALEALLYYPWPGNVRELQNVLERAVAFAEGDQITAADLDLKPPAASPTTAGVSPAARLPTVNLDELERRAIQQALDETKGNKAEAARRLGISEKSIYNKIKASGETAQ
jgi:DNA-binding NtrC family response regulator